MPTKPGPLGFVSNVGMESIFSSKRGFPLRISAMAEVGMDGLRQSNGCCGYPDVTDVLGWKICNAPLVGAWFLAVCIGVMTAIRMWALGPHCRGTLTYSVTFLLYAVMITSGLVVHCVFLVECGASKASQLYVDMGLVDASLTSCVAVCFVFNALVDGEVIRERSAGTLAMMIASFAGVFFLYFFTDVNKILSIYFVSVGVCCSAYVVCQVIFLLKRTLHPMSSFVLLLGAAVAGGGSFLLVGKFACWMCSRLGAWSLEGMWYYGSDVSMFFLSLYAICTRSLQAEPQTPNKKLTLHPAPGAVSADQN